MSLRLFRPGIFSRVFYPGALFRFRTCEKILCLTFDDGPDPCSTPEILKILAKREVKALFFCTGRNAESYPRLVQEIIASGHKLGNHGYDHLDGWRSSYDDYFENVVKASAFLPGIFFRPPYGRMKPSQFRRLSKEHTIVMWDLMAYDFDKLFGAGRSLEILRRKIRAGSVIVLHDTPQSTVPDFLDDFLAYCIMRGYRFELP
jgi:peptidoglycan/xylan/chitin deacetylase (PgdA/CDA1 family)